MDLIELSPLQLQEVDISLNPHVLMEQIHCILKVRIIKVRIIKYLIAVQRQRTYEKKETEEKN